MSSPLTTHVLDTSSGNPAAGVGLKLEFWHDGDHWHEMGSAETDADGRCGTLLEEGAEFGPGLYRLTFDAGSYFAGRGQESFYTLIPVVFRVTEPQPHQHVPLLLSPFSYSTDRGS